ncbi:MAG: SRPBCC family protein [Gammaproteobacteria bacterium]|nr:SRPBCC family protein [Gammaproteobacteria bacterium]
MSAVLSGCDHGTDFSDFEALTITRMGSFELDMTPDEAQPLFTAPGEKLWISIWDPAILHGDGYEKGTVFVTTNHGHTAYWLVSDYDTEAKHAQYVRVTPGANTGTVDVSVTSNGSGGATVSVVYQLTGLSPAGNADLEESFSESKYAAMMEEWRDMINDSRETIDEHFGR